MRYVIAMLIAIPVALAATMYLSSPIATWFTALFTYDDPDTVADRQKPPEKNSGGA